MALFLFPFMLVWSGISIGAIYGSQIRSGHFNLIPSLFGIPFLIGTLLLAWKALISVMGKVEIRTDRLGGKIFTGIGPFGFTKKFQWLEIDSINEYISMSNKSRQTRIALNGQKRIRFGSDLNSSKRYYLLKSMQTLHRSMRDAKF